MFKSLKPQSHNSWKSGRIFVRRIISGLRSGVEVKLKSLLLPRKYFFWHPSYGNDPIPINFGDDLFGKIVSKITGEEVFSCGPGYLGKKLLIGGSTMSFARNGDQVWGAGIRDGYLDPKLRRLKIYAVRGPLTAAIMKKQGIDVPPCYGDPAILWPGLFPHLKRMDSLWDVGIIPHFREMQSIERLSFPANSKIISPVQNPLNVLEQMRFCKRVVASSLHGIICAEALGIPVEPYKTSGEPDFKYQDYFAATQREWAPHLSILDAINGEFNPPPNFSAEIKSLIKAFPT
jgi:pyruvyltransferase